MQSIACHFCGSPTALLCTRCRTRAYCSAKCSGSDISHVPICGYVNEELPPFPIEKEIAFLRLQANSASEFRLYGSAAVLRTMDNRGMDPTAYRRVLDTELELRRELLERYVYTLTSADLRKELPYKYAHTTWWQSKPFAFPELNKILVEATHSAETVERIVGVVDNGHQDLREAASQGDETAFVALFLRLVRELTRLDDFLINSNNLHKAVAVKAFKAPELLTQWAASVKRVRDAKHAEFTKMRQAWANAQPLFGRRFPLGYDDARYVRLIREGDTFYRGQMVEHAKTNYSFHGRVPRPHRKTAWFAVEPWTAMIYIVPTYSHHSSYADYCYELGHISVFQARHEFTILDLSIAENIRAVRRLVEDDGRPDVLQAFDESWIVANNTIKRKSELKVDLVWVTWMCDHGFSGYIADDSVGMAPEIFLCDWTEHMKYVGTYDSTKVLRVDFCNEPYKSLNLLFNVF